MRRSMKLVEPITDVFRYTSTMNSVGSALGVVFMAVCALGFKSAVKVELLQVSDSCPLPPVLANSALSSNTAQNSATYTCMSGYVSSLDSKSTTFTAVCDPAQGTFNLKGFACIPGQCAVSGRSNSAPSQGTASAVVAGTVVKYVCNPGSTIDGMASSLASFNMICDQSTFGLVSVGGAAGVTDCAPITCGVATAPPSSALVYPIDGSSRIQVGQNARYQCNPGTYSVMDPSATVLSVQCSADGQLAASPGCSVASCGVPPILPGAVPVGISSQNVLVGSSITYNCNSGSLFHNATNGVSAGFGSGSGSGSGAGSGSVPASPYEGLNSFRVSCYLLSGNGPTVPVFDTLPPSRCMSTTCGDPPLMPGSSISASTTPSSNYYPGDSVQYTCNSGTGLAGSPARLKFTANCQDDKSWAWSTSETCKPLTCGSVASIPDSMLVNAQITSNSGLALNLGDTLMASCVSGAATPNGLSSYTIMCGANGKFSATNQCVMPCTSVPTFANARLTHDSGSGVASQSDAPAGTGAQTILSGTVLNYVCASGYTVDGSVSGASGFSTTCTESGSLFPGNLTDCQPISCGAAPVIANSQEAASNAYPSNKYLVSGPALSYNCQSGYGIPVAQSSGATSFIPSTSFTCTSAGWSPAPSSIQCSPVNCGLPPNPMYSKIISSGASSQPRGTSQPNGGNGPLAGQAQPAIPGTSLTYTCDTGYIPTRAIADPGTNYTSFTATCQSSGNWDKDLSSACSPVTCPTLVPTVTLPGSTAPATIVGTVGPMMFGDPARQYQCNPLWGLPAINVTCNADTSYSLTGSPCIEPKCSDLLSAWTNAVAPPAPVSIGTVSTISCATGYRTASFKTSFVAACSPGGVWTNPGNTDTTGCPNQVAYNDADPGVFLH